MVYNRVYELLRNLIISIYYLLYSLFVCLVFILCPNNVSEKLRKIFFANFFSSVSIVRQLDSCFDEHRPKWLKDFTELMPNNEKVKLKILEIGVGAGSNFDHYPNNAILTALDYNECFKVKCMETLKNYPNIDFDAYLTGIMEDMHQIDDNSFDAVLISHVFCSVDDIPRGLSEIKRVLKKGGKLFFIEHVAYEQHLFWSRIQKLLNSYWKVIMCNCQLTKQTWIYLENAEFSKIEINHKSPDNIPGFIRAHIWGWAQK